MTEEHATVGGIFRLTATLALTWGVSPRAVLFVLAMEAPDEARFGRLVARCWDDLPAAARCELNALSSRETS